MIDPYSILGISRDASDEDSFNTIKTVTMVFFTNAIIARVT